ncbi:hypothetical protein N7472_004561 [Penicillium cf. griseofulvum]|uniref:Uncharacterized protein n=1 Tax=Penicillium cf. griseofulvum TaxID=2972120 RepID=A0A9W9MFV2_9EURO|nr:hypothetical protein N7472_004561 [Penicillium cf. griseofulvum]
MDNPSVPQEADPAGAAGVPSGMPLSSFDSLQDDLVEAYRKYFEYAELISTGHNLAPQFADDSLWSSDIQRMAARIFGEPRPRVVEAEDTVRTLIEWTDVLGAMLTVGDFERQPNGMYHCRVRGVLIEVTMDTYFEILTGVTDRLLQPLQGLSDEQKETRVRLKLRANLVQTYYNLFTFSHSVMGSIEDLDSPQFVHTGAQANPAPEEVEIPTTASVTSVLNNPNSQDYSEDSSSDSEETQNPAVKEGSPAAKEEQVNSELSDIPRHESVNSAHDTQGHVSAADFLGQYHIDSESDSDEYFPTSQSGASFTGSNVNSNYAISASDVLERHSTDLPIDMDNSGYLGDVSRDDSAVSASNVDNDAQPLNVLRGNSIGPVRNPDTRTVIYTSLLAAVEQVNSMNANAGLVDNTTTHPVNNNVVSNMDTINANARAEKSSTTSNTASNLVGPWLENISTPVYTNDNNANPSESEIHPRIKNEDTSGSTVIVAENSRRTRSGGPKRTRVESPYPAVPAYKPRTFIKYTRDEAKNASAFANRMVEMGCTIEELETEYAEKFSVSRTATAICKKFSIKGSYAFLKPIREAKKQKTESG